MSTTAGSPMHSFSMERSTADNKGSAFELSATPRSTFSTASVSLLGTEVNTFCFCIPLNWILAPKEGEEVKIRNSDVSTVFLLLNYMIGSGIIVQPYVFSQSGIVLCVFLFIIISLMNYVGVNLLVLCAEEMKVFDFSELADTILGYWGSVLVDVSIIIGAAGGLLSYILIIGTLLTEVVGDCSEWYCDVVFMTLFPLLAISLPLCLLRNFGHLAIASYISISVITATIMLVLIGGPAQETTNSDKPSHYRLANFAGMVNTVGDIVFALGYITATFHAYNAMRNRTTSNFNKTTLATTVIGAVMCFFTGLAGYLTFGSDTDTNILQNFNGSVGDVFKAALVGHLLLYIPGDFVIMRAAIMKLCDTDVATQSNASFFTVSLGSLGLIVLIALVLQVYLSSKNSLAIVVDLTGGVAGSILYFIVPSLCALRVLKDDPWARAKSVVLLIFGSLIVLSAIASAALA